MYVLCAFRDFWDFGGVGAGPGDRRGLLKDRFVEGPRVSTYSVRLDVPRNLVFFVAGLLRANRGKLGTRRGTRKLSCYRQAVFILAWMRDGTDIARLGAGFGISRTTAYNRHAEALQVIAEQAVGLSEALAAAVAGDLPYVILDGTLVRCDRLAEQKTGKKGGQIPAWFSGKNHCFGGNIQAITSPAGVPLWTSDVHPGSVPDITQARAEVLAIAGPFLADLPILADCGYVGAGHGVYTPVKQPKNGTELSDDILAYNRLQRGLRFPGERGFALLFGRWKALRHVTMSPRRISDLMRAAIVLTQFEHKMITQ